MIFHKLGILQIRSLAKLGGTTINYHLTVLNRFRYDGAWTTADEGNTFDGSVYYNMMYSAKDPDDTQSGNFIVSDFAIVYDFTVDEDTRFANREVTADDPTCDEASTYGTVEAFAAVIIIKLQRDS